MTSANRDNFTSFPIRVTFISFLSPISCVRWRRQWQPTPVFLPGKSHGRKSLVGCSPWGRWESGTTERLHFYFSLSCIGEGNGNPLQCSYLEMFTVKFFQFCCIIKHFNIKMLEKIILSWKSYILLYFYTSATTLLPCSLPVNMIINHLTLKYLLNSLCVGHAYPV